jgi:hypothetical protein
VGFFTAAGAFISETHSVVTGNSAGWLGTIAGSPFIAREEKLTVPAGAGKIRVALASAGPLATLGVMVIDDVSVGVVPSTVLIGNFFPNSTFEDGSQLDNPALAAPAGGWSRGGSDGSADQVTTAHSVSPTHALSLLDNNDLGYGEWYMFLTLSPFGVGDNDALDLQWFQIYSVTNGNMRLSFACIDSVGSQLANSDFSTTADSPGWTGSVATSPFERRSGRILVPAGTVKLRVNFASGGSSGVTGIMVIDDLSVRISKPAVTAFTGDAGNRTITWASMPSKTYKVQFASSLGTVTTWTSLATGLVATPGALETSYLDTVVHAGGGGFYRVVQE